MPMMANAAFGGGGIMSFAACSAPPAPLGMPMMKRMGRGNEVAQKSLYFVSFDRLCWLVYGLTDFLVLVCMALPLKSSYSI
jgi:hypothetical protein